MSIEKIRTIPENATENVNIFAMNANGLYQDSGGEWIYKSGQLDHMEDVLAGEKVALFGPAFEKTSTYFFFNHDVDPEVFIPALSQRSVQDVVRKYLKLDEDQAERISYILGGIIREFNGDSILWKNIPEAIDFASKSIVLGDKASGDAIALGTAKYLLSGGSLQEDKKFKGEIYHMSDAISRDPVIPTETADLGFSQALRLKAFKENINVNEFIDLVKIKEDIELLSGFPTIGAEFHLNPWELKKDPDLLKRIALLNMSAYQQGSFIQMSGVDENVLEIRMNPSIYPIAISNWQMIRKLIPEIDKSYFTITLNTNSSSEESNFTWENPLDVEMLEKLKFLGRLIYASKYQSLPKSEIPGDIRFGDVYLGQTVKLSDEGFSLTGEWGGQRGKSGQFAIYTGYRDIFPSLALFSSMLMVNPQMLDFIDSEELTRFSSLNDVYNTTEKQRMDLFRQLTDSIRFDPRLNKAHRAGYRIMGALSSTS